MPRILILHASVGAGHKSAATALAVAFARKQAGDVRVEDTLDYSSAVFRQTYARSYLELSERAPMLWGMFYQNTDTTAPELIELSNRLRGLAARLTLTRLERLIRQFAPAAIICTHFLPVELLLRLKLDGRLPQPVYCVVTDYGAHSFWALPGIDGYFVGTEMARDQLVARGVPSSIVHISGIPVNPEIADPKLAQAMRTRHGLPLDRAVVCLFGGGLALERVQLMVEGMLARDLPAMLAVVAGRNEALARALDELGAGEERRLRKLGFITYVDDLVAASDLVISKAGGLIVSEKLARGAPMVLIDPSPGQEEWNADYVVSMGAGIQLRMAEAVPMAVECLLAHPDRLATLRACARATGRARASLDIAEHVLHDLRTGVHA